MRELFQKVGFGWAVRILAFVMLATLSLSLAVLKPHTSVKRKVPIFRATFLLDLPYTLFILGTYYITMITVVDPHI